MRGPLRQRGGPRNGETPDRRNVDTYTATHWGERPEWYFVDPDPLLPGQLSVMGRLLEIVYDDGRDGQAWSIAFPQSGRDGAVLSFDSRGTTRLFVQYTPGSDLRSEVREAHWTAHPRAPTYDLDEVARAARGRQQGNYPRVNVKVLGRVIEVYYRTKKGDGANGAAEVFVHELGTEPDNDLLPWLCVDATGRLWWAGGDYRVLPDGIVG